MTKKLVKLVAGIVIDFQRELRDQQTQSILEMANALAAIPVPKAKLRASAIIPNFMEARAQQLPEHLAFEDLLHSARVAVVRDVALENEFQVLASTIVRAAKSRTSEQEMSRWPFRNTLVSPSFIRDVLDRKGL
jgi:hypothetical protein